MVMSDLPPQGSAVNLLKENSILKRRIERMKMEMKALIALHDRAIKLRDFSEQEKKLQYEYNVLLLENAPDMIFILNPEMCFRLGTKAFVRFLRHEDDTTLRDLRFDEFFSGIMPEKWIESTYALFESAMNERKHIQYNDEINLNGTRKVFSISAAPAISSDGKTMGIICLMYDSTELVEMKEAAEAAAQAKSSFLASMSHEIRTPMNAIKGFSDLMSKTPLSNQQKAYVDNITTATSSLLTIIDDILDFSKIEANKYEIVKEKYDTASEFSDIYNLMKQKAEEKGIGFIIYVDPGIPSELIGDYLRIRQILVNIIGNAIKFTSEGCIVFSVSGKLILGNEWLLTFSIKDTGQGIKEEELSKIFRSFEQLDIYKNRNISGTGLGLAISKSLSELMGGNISVKSEYGVGSEFSVNIPLTAASECAITYVENPEEKKILLFNTNKEFAALAERFLERLNVSHKVILDADAFYNAVREENFTHIVIDNDLELAGKIAGMCPDTYVGCLRNISSVAIDMPDNVKLLFKPLLVVSLAMFICSADCKDMVNTKKANRLGSRSFKDARVLIVDDNEINLIVASEIIKTYDIEPEVANSGPEAIGKVKNKNYDLVFMDHMMPGMNGLEAMAAIRALDIPQPTIVALTANAILGVEDFYIKSGFDGYISKPIDIDNLNTILDKWLGS